MLSPRSNVPTESVRTSWRVQREGTVASKTYNTEGYALKHLEPLRKRPLGAVTAADLNALYSSMLKKLSRETVVRFRQIVSAFYSWAVSEKLVAENPVLDSKVPAGTAQRARKEIYPFTYAELLAVHAVILANTSKVLADTVLVLGLTGVRWGELAALRVRDVQELPYPALRVVRSKPDGQPVRNVTKGGKARTVPLTVDAAAIILPLVAGRMPDQLVFPSGAGGFRANNNFKRDAH